MTLLDVPVLVPEPDEVPGLVSAGGRQARSRRLPRRGLCAGDVLSLATTVLAPGEVLDDDCLAAEFQLLARRARRREKPHLICWEITLLQDLAHHAPNLAGCSDDCDGGHETRSNLDFRLSTPCLAPNAPSPRKRPPAHLRRGRRRDDHGRRHRPRPPGRGDRLRRVASHRPARAPAPRHRPGGDDPGPRHPAPEPRQ